MHALSQDESIQKYDDNAGNSLYNSVRIKCSVKRQGKVEPGKPVLVCAMPAESTISETFEAVL